MQPLRNRRSIATACVFAAAFGWMSAADAEPKHPARGEKPQPSKEAAVREPATDGEKAPPTPAQTDDRAAAAAQRIPKRNTNPPSTRHHRPPAAFRGPDITLIAGEERTIYEYRQNGQLRMIKVVPKFGKPYYLTPRDPTRGWGDLEQADALVAEWVLWEF